MITVHSRAVVIVPVLVALVAAGVTAQSADAEDAAAEDAAAEEETKTIEELYLESQASIAAVSSMVESYDRQSQAMGVRLLVRHAENGTIDTSSDEYVAIAAYALRGGVGRVANNRSRLPDSYHPIVRVDAARALGRSSNPEAQTVLITALREDPEPSVVGATMLALARRGQDEDGFVSYEIATSLQRELAVRQDGGMIYAGLQALEDIVKEVGHEDFHPEVRATVVEIATSGLNRAIREKAISVLNQM